MEKVIITADSTFDMTPELIQALDIRVIPSYVSFGEDMVDDYPNLRCDDLFTYYQTTGTLAKTAAASPWDYTQFFQALCAEKDVALVHIAKSSALSSCYDHALQAAEEFDNVHVVDSRILSGGSALLAIAAAQSTLGAQARAEMLREQCTRIEGSFLLETLEYLQKGGRCSALSLLGANMLRIRPEIVFDQGQMKLGKKYRGKYASCVAEFIRTRLADPTQYDPQLLYLNHTLQDAALLAQTVAQIEALGYFQRIIAHPAGAAVACHCGPNTFGFFCLKK